MVFSGTLRRVAFVRTDASKELSASFIRVTRIGELGKTLPVTSNRHKIGELGTTLAVTNNRLGISLQRASVASYS
jgi:hypothetical protein